jgi:inosose dehydratase
VPTTLSRQRVALNAIQWINVKADPTNPASADLWLYREPSFRMQYPDVLQTIADAGFGAVMMEVLDTQTLQDYARMLDRASLIPAPGYAQIGLPEDHGLTIRQGSSEWTRWFNGVRRKAEESLYFGLDTIFLAPEVAWEGAGRTLTKSAVGHDFDPDRLERVIDVLGEATDVLLAEGVSPGLHNHVGTWVETADEIDAVLAGIPQLRASFDVGHLAWAGIDPVEMISRHAGRLGDLHIKDLDLALAAASRRDPGPYRRTTNQRFFLEPGLGDIDLDRVIDALPSDYAGWLIIEVDRASMHPDDSARVSKAWVDRTFA